MSFIPTAFDVYITKLAVELITARQVLDEFSGAGQLRRAELDAKFQVTYARISTIESELCEHHLLRSDKHTDLLLQDIGVTKKQLLDSLNTMLNDLRVGTWNEKEFGFLMEIRNKV